MSEVDVNVKEEEIRQVFGRFGKVDEVLKKSVGAKVSLFVVFGEPKSVVSALAESGKLMVAGKAVRISQFLEMSQLQPEANVLIDEVKLYVIVESSHSATQIDN